MNLLCFNLEAMDSSGRGTQSIHIPYCMSFYTQTTVSCPILCLEIINSTQFHPKVSYTNLCLLGWPAKRTADLQYDVHRGPYKSGTTRKGYLFRASDISKRVEILQDKVYEREGN